MAPILGESNSEWPFGRGPTTRSLGDLRSPSWFSGYSMGSILGPLKTNGFFRPQNDGPKGKGGAPFKYGHFWYLC